MACPTTKTVLLENSPESKTQLGKSSHFSGPQGSRAQTSALVSHYMERGAGEGKCSSEPGGVPKALSGGSRSDRSAWHLPIRAEGSCELRFCKVGLRSSELLGRLRFAMINTRTSARPP